MRDLIVGVDAGTSVLKAVAFDLEGHQVAVASVPNAFTSRPDGAVTQPLPRTWSDCAATLRALGERVPDLAARSAALAVTGQGDGTWLIDGAGAPLGEGWLWLDSRAAPEVRAMRADPADRARFAITGTGLNAAQMGMQLRHMDRQMPDLLEGAATAFHCKDWLYLNLTGARVTDPTEACFTFGDFRTRAYDARVIAALGLSHRDRLLPPILDGVRETLPLTEAAARATGLRAGTPVALGYVDVICTSLGAGIHAPGVSAGCTIVGSTGMHMRATTPDAVRLGTDATGYVMCLPIPGMVAQMQSNMAATLNLDWILALAADLAADLGRSATRADLLGRVDGWVARGAPGALVYHPYISEAGERGPFVDNAARASLIGLNTGHRFPDLVRAVVEGLGMAARDCYAAMGPVPDEIRVSGGAARSAALRGILAAALDRPVRASLREEAGAAGAAMIAAVAIGAFPDMERCIAAWVTPALGAPEPPDPGLAAQYAALFPSYLAARRALAPVWDAMDAARP